MSDDEFDDEPELDEEFDGDLDEDALDDDDDLVDDDDALLDEEEEEELVTAGAEDEEADEDEAASAATTEEDDEEIIDLDEELHPDDVEEALDVVLRERTAKAGLEDEDDDDDEPDERGEAGTKIVPRRPGEFVCSSCFLVLPRHMLADADRQLCSDCA
jgi:hypothetical protein